MYVLRALDHMTTMKMCAWVRAAYCYTININVDVDYFILIYIFKMSERILRNIKYSAQSPRVSFTI